MAAERQTVEVAGELDRLRLENETLSGIVGVVSSGPDLGHILDRVVDLLSRATRCHACFIYLRVGDRLVLRAASPVYSHLVGKITFAAGEGLAGWAMREGEPAFVPERALDDPRTNYVAELEEERFQSMAAVPIPSRGGEPIGAIVLHTVAPREFDEGTLNVLFRAASLLAGAIENARLYEEAQQRVVSLTRLSDLGREIAGVADRDSLSAVAVTGVRALLEADVCRLYEVDGESGLLARIASMPPAADADEDESRLVRRLVEPGRPLDSADREKLAAALGLPPEAAVAAAQFDAAGEPIGAILAASAVPLPESGRELLRAAAQQVSLASQKIDLIEHLTEENLARDLFDALLAGELGVAGAKAAAAGLELNRPHLVLVARPSEGADAADWSELAVEAERAIKRSLPAAFCEITPTSLRAVVPAGGRSVGSVREEVRPLSRSAGVERLFIGVSEARSGVEGVTRGLGEAGDAAAIAPFLGGDRHVVLYRDTGAYRYLIDALDSGGPQDHLRAAVDEIAAYDRERGSQLLLTLDEYLSQGRSVASTARDLFIHVNTLRQRLERIETLTGLSIADEDLLALQLAVKLGRARLS